jgi:uncharacterized protein YnzC (UPF0291/DUF896 family)
VTRNITKEEEQQQRKLKNTRKNIKKFKAIMKNTINNITKKEEGFQFIINGTKGKE